MKKILRNILLAGTICLASFLPLKGLEARTAIQEDTVKTEETKKNNFNINLNGCLKNKSRFWGFPFSDTPVYTESLSANYGKFSASIAGDININDKKLFNVQTSIGFSQPLSKKISFYLGYVFFYFNMGEGWDNASIAYAGLAADLPLNPSITYNRLIRFGGGDYIEGKLSENLPLTKNIGVNLSGKIGYNNKVMRNKSGFTHLEGDINIPIKLSDKIALSPYINYFQALSDDIKSGFTCGLAVNTKF
jgi:hypothetical protein